MPDQNNKSYSVELAEITARLFSNCNEKEIRHAKQYGVSIGEFRCLRSLYHKKDPTVNQLALDLSITSSRVTRIVDGLVAKKLVRRITGETDRRIFNLSLTPKGEKLAAELVLKHIKIHEEIINQIPEDVHQLMIEMLGQLNRAVEDWLKK